MPKASKTAIEQPDPLPPVAFNPVPLVEAAPVAADDGTDPTPYIPDERFTDGLWTRNSDGEVYALCIHKPDGYQQTHTARNSIHQWQGVAADFFANFQRK